MIYSIYSALVSIRDSISRLINAFRRTTNWEPDVPGSIGGLCLYIRSVYKWTPDYVFGLLDNVQSIRHMNWQLQHSGVIEGDCDDFAKYTCYLLYRMGYMRSYIVSVIPMRHVICVFNNNGTYDVFSNGVYYNLAAQSVDDAVIEYAAANSVNLNSFEYVVVQYTHNYK